MSQGVLMFLALLGGAVFFLSQALIVPTLSDAARTRRLLRQKLKGLDRSDGERPANSLLREKYLRNLSPLARRLESLPVLERLVTLIEQTGRTTLAHRVVLLSLLAGLVAGYLAFSYTKLLWFGAAACAAAFSVPYVMLLRERAARFAKIEEQLPDAIDVMKRALRAGHPFAQSLKLVADDMDQPIAKEFELTFADVNFGSDLRRALLGLLARVPSANIMAMVTAVLIQKETGGNLAEIFEGLSRVIRSRFRFQRKVRTLSAEGRLSAWILALVPIVLFALLWVMSPAYLPHMLDVPEGRQAMLFAGVMMMLGVLWMRRIIRIDI